MNEAFNPITERFSAGYDLVHNARIIEYDEAEAIMDFEMYDALARRFGRNFIGKIGNLRYEFKPEQQIPAGAVAVPADNHDGPETLLIQR